jgi:acyl-CoA hydrolase
MSVKSYVSAEEAVRFIKSDQRIFIHSVAAAPQQLIRAMTDRAPELRNVEIVHLHTEGAAPYTAPGMQDSFRLNALFVGANAREAVQSGRADYIPNFLSEVPGFFRKGILPIDVALVHVSPPDAHGYSTLGVSVDVSLAAVETARVVIAQVNPNMPRVHGEGVIHHSRFQAMVWCEDPILDTPVTTPDALSCEIGRQVSELVEDGATLQVGIGAIPNAVLSQLGNHKDLGIHSEMFSDGILPLVEKGVITGRYKKKRPEKIVGGFVLGSGALYDFINDNPIVELLDIGYVNNTYNIMQNPKVTAINSAMEVDLTGQVCADSIGSKIYSGVGGQMDFIRGASLSEGGKPIIALPSRTRSGAPRIVPVLKQGAGVVTTRAHVHYVVTEYGIANLYGMNLRQRAKALINIAHPDDREMLEKAVCEMFAGF